MKRLLLLLALSACALPAHAEWCADADGGVKYNSTSERSVELPQDQDRWYTTVMYDPSDSQGREVCSWFQTNDELAKIQAGTHFSAMPSNSPMFRSRYATTVNDLPCIRIQDEKGVVVYQISGRNMPLTSEALANSIKTSCIRRQPLSQAEPSINFHYHYNVDQKEKEKSNPDLFLKGNTVFDMPIWLACVIAVGATLVGVGHSWKQEFKSAK
jgi:hypothetical protein